MHSHHGAGSFNEPIVISDDEDEAAYVEFALEQRISSPTDDIDHEANNYAQEVSDVLLLRDPSSVDEVASTDAQDATVGQKRKRANSTVNGQPLPLLTESLHGRAVSPDAPPGESRQARKKRRKRERLAAKASNAQAVVSPVVPIPQLSPKRKPAKGKNNLPSKPVPLFLPQSSPPMPPPAYLDAHAASIFPYSLMPPVAMVMPQIFPSAPIDLPIPLAPDFPTAMLPAAELQPHDTPVSSKKQIGMSANHDPYSRFGVYELPPSSMWRPDPARSLVMEIMPKKFRSTPFILDWAGTICPPGASPHIELDVKRGKALIEFPTAEIARAAWESPRLHGGGREHIRAYWYRVPDAHAHTSELEDGEIEDGEVVDQDPKSKPAQSAFDISAVPPPFSFPPFPSSYAGSVTFADGKWRSTSLSNPSSQLQSNVPALQSTLSASTSREVNIDHGYAEPLYRTPIRRNLRVPSRQLDPVTGRIEKITWLTPEPLPPSPTRLSLDERLKLPPRASPSPSPLDAPPVIEYREHVADTNSLPLEESMDISSEDGPPVVAEHNDFVPDDPFDEVEIVEIDPTSIASFTDEPLSPSGREVVEEAYLGGDEYFPPQLLAQPISAAPLPVHAPSPHSSIKTTSIYVPRKSNNSPSPTPPASVSSTSLPFGDTFASSSATSSSISTPSTVNAKTMGQDIKEILRIRQKELAEEMTRTREAIASRASASRSAAATPPVEKQFLSAKPSEVFGDISVLSASSAGIKIAETDDGARNSAKEDELRRLVLSSKRSKAASAAALARPAEAAKAAGQASASVSSTIHESAPLSDRAPTAVSGSSVKITTATIDLDNLAASFIAETIQTISAPFKPSIPPHPSSTSTTTPPPPSRMSEKELLVAKHRLLEQKIAESKEFMAQYSAAPTKSQKMQVMKKMNERMRMLDEEMKTLEDTHTAHPPPPSSVQKQWPEPRAVTMVIDISDDEDEDE